MALHPVEPASHPDGRVEVGDDGILQGAAHLAIGGEAELAGEAAGGRGVHASLLGDLVRRQEAARRAIGQENLDQPTV